MDTLYTLAFAAWLGSAALALLAGSGRKARRALVPAARRRRR
jgi:hypothetical protein